jgi:hypothetical protein
MGNGFTFELESLIFWALTRATFEASVIKDRGDRRLCAVYGDDIICPQEMAWYLTTVLNYCGFSVNLDKSFYEGNFFESCGKHFFYGVDVTPVYQKERITDLASSIRAVNRLVRYGMRNLSDGYRDANWAVKAASKLRDRTCPSSRLPFLPWGTEGDDGYLLTPFQMEKLLTKVIYDKNAGVKCVVIKIVHERIPSHEAALYTYRLREIYNRLSVKPGEATLEGDGYVDSRVDSSVRTSFGVRWVHPH